jgi:hypothetical protein
MNNQGFGLRFEEVKGLAERLEKAQEIFSSGRIEAIEGMDAYVVSNSEAKHYLVSPDGRCSCPDYQFGAPRSWCKHRMAVELLKEAMPEEDGRESEERSLEDKLSDLYPMR